MKLHVSITYFRQYHADWPAIEAELQSRCGMLGEWRHIRSNDEAGQTTISWWSDLLSAYSTDEIAQLLMTTIGDMREMLDQRPMDLITASYWGEANSYSLNWTPGTEEQRRREERAIAANWDRLIGEEAPLHTA